MRGLDPRIDPKKKSRFKTMDCRVKPGNDAVDKSMSAAVGPSPHSGLSGPRNWELIQPFQRVLST
jgi:hypothetical protein